MDIFSGTVWLLEEVVFALINVLEGCLAVVSVIPMVIENVLFLLELFILGFLACIEFIANAVRYILLFLVELPENVGHALVFLVNGMEVLISWTVMALDFLIMSFEFCFKFTVALLNKGIFYTTKLFGAIFNKIPVIHVSAFRNSILYIGRVSNNLLRYILEFCVSLMSLPFKLMNNLLQLCKTIVSLPMVALERFFNMFIQLIDTLLFSTINFLKHSWKIFYGSLTNLLTFLWPFSADDVYLKENQDSTSKHRGEILYTGSPSWLTRFSQLMLAFAVIILISVFVVVLYHMRFKIKAMLTTMLTTLKEAARSVFIREQRAVNANNNRGAERRVEVVDNVDDAADDGIDISDDDGDDGRPVLRNRQQLIPSAGGSSQMGARGASPAPPQDYRLLLQRERDKQLCVVCQDKEKDTLLMPCKHLCVCSGCVDHITNAPMLDMRRCPLCRKKITAYVDVFT